MKNIQTTKEEITIIIRVRDFDKACKLAYEAALRKFDINESGSCNDRKTFPRSYSSLVVDFVSLRMIGCMSGQVFQYKFSTFMECNRE